MGIQYRDYMRDERGRGYGSTGLQGRDMVKSLIIANVIVFVLQAVLTRPYTPREIDRMIDNWLQSPDMVAAFRDATPEDLEMFRQEQADLLSRERVSYVESWFALDPQKVLAGQIWRLTTYDFLHDVSGIWHIVFNMWLLWLMGRNVESFYGPQEFLCFYLLAGIVSGVGFLLWGIGFKDMSPAIGASGAVAAVVVVFAMHWPHEEFRIFGILPIPAYFMAVFAAISDLHPMLLQIGGHGFVDNVAHSAHLGGMAFGVLYVHQNWRLAGWLRELPHLRWWKRRPPLRVHRPSPLEAVPPQQTVAARTTPKADVAERVDALLAKINEQGSASLTTEEQQFLAEASRLYRDRKS